MSCLLLCGYFDTVGGASEQAVCRLKVGRMNVRKLSNIEVRTISLYLFACRLVPKSFDHIHRVNAGRLKFTKQIYCTYTVHLRYVSFCCATGKSVQSKRSRRAVETPSRWFGSSTRHLFFRAGRRKPDEKNIITSVDGQSASWQLYKNWNHYLQSINMRRNTQMLTWRFRNFFGLCLRTVILHGDYVLLSQP